MRQQVGTLRGMGCKTKALRVMCDLVLHVPGEVREQRGCIEWRAVVQAPEGPVFYAGASRVGERHMSWTLRQMVEATGVREDTVLFPIVQTAGEARTAEAGVP